MWALTSRFILRYKLFLLVSIGLATFFMAQKAEKVLYSYEFMSLLPEDDPISIEYQEFLSHFGQEGNVMVVGFQSDSLFQVDHFNAFYDVCDQLENVVGVEQVTSLLQVYDLEKNTDLKSFEFKSLIPDRLETQEEVSRIQQKLSQLPFYHNLFYNDEEKAYLMALTLDKRFLNSEARVDLIHLIEDIITPFAEQIKVDVHYSGLPYIRTKGAVKTKAEVQMFIFWLWALLP